MRCRFSISALALTAAALGALAGTRPSLAAAPVATYTMTDRGGLAALFVPDGMNSVVLGLEEAQAQLLDNGVFTITSRTLPPITGKWSASLNPNIPSTSFWAKTDQINLNGLIFGNASNADQAALFSVQVNAPRTDGAPGSGTGLLPPTSFQLTQLWVPAAGGGPVTGPSILAADNPATNAALAALAAASSATSAVPVGTYTMTDQGAILANFVPDGTAVAAKGLDGAQLQLLANGVFTTKSLTLPPIIGRWSQNGAITSFWSKTDQIDFNGTVTGAAPDGSPVVWYSVQVNAPRTDGSQGNKGGALSPASFQLLQVWMSADGAGGILAGGGSSKR